MLGVATDSESLQRSPAGSISGRIWLASESLSFPEEGWSDLPVILLSAWLEGLREVSARRESSTRLLFMDGPFEAILSSESLTVTRVSFLRREQRFMSDLKVDPDYLLQSARQAAGDVVEVCIKREWLNEDLRKLRRVMKSGC